MDNVQSDLKPTMLDMFLRNLPQSEFENALFAADLRQTAIVTMDRSRCNNNNNYKSNREETRDISQSGNSMLDDKERRRLKTRIALKKSGYVLDREEIVLKKFSSMPHLAPRIEEQSSPQSAKSQSIKNGNNISRDDSSGCASSPILQSSRDEQSPSMTVQSEKSVQTRPVQNSIQEYFLPLLHVLQADNIDQAVIRPNQHKRVVGSQDIVLIDEPYQAEVLTDMSLLDELCRQRPVSVATSFTSTLSSTLSPVNNTITEDSSVLKSKSSSPVDSSPPQTRSNTFAQYSDLSSSSPAASSSPSLSSDSLQQQQHQIISISQDLIEDVRNKATAPGKSAFDTLYECLDPHL
ncbi:hypothetical protein MIR68_011880 [Amoeboaphelidium protococcarum]|nr:hypothetical protein MIR68_011880 [Amoeboaphelidium protococcarum]